MATALDKIKLAKQAANSLGLSSTVVKNQVLANIAALLPARAVEIIAANQKDLDRGVADGLATGLMDRLRLDGKRINSLAAAVTEVISLPDPIGDVVRGKTLANGVRLAEVSALSESFTKPGQT
jgi:glutamate-5-semialdehyde dehydrogenase